MKYFMGIRVLFSEWKARVGRAERWRREKLSLGLLSTALKKWFSRPQEDLTILMMSRGHREVQKLRVSPSSLWILKVSLAVSSFIFLLSLIFFVDFLIKLPERELIRAENEALRKELLNLQFHMDTLQGSVDRMARYDQKLRALTSVDRQFLKTKGPSGQGGGEDAEAEDLPTEVDSILLGDQRISGETLDLNAQATYALDRRDVFTLQKIYSWMRRFYKDADLQEQSIEELFEVLKGREIQLTATPSIIPVRGWVTSHFGYRFDPFTGRRAFHRGMDISARAGTPIMAPADGVVTYTGPYGGFGKTVMLFHGYGVSTLYAHASELHVVVGQKVKRGERIASVGNTGRSTASHLHYEVILHGVPVDPRKFILDRSL